jgi:gluconokinase
MSAKLILAIDIGTSSTRSALFEADAERLVKTTAQEKYPLITTPDGGAEIEPAVVLQATRRCLAQTLQTKRRDKKLRDRPIAGIGACSFWHSFVGCDDSGKPLTRIITWADARCRSDAARLRTVLAEEEAHAETGCMLRTSFWPAKLAWLQRTNAAVARRVQRWISPAEWIQWKLAGTTSCAIGMATGTGLFNPQTLTWSPKILELIGLDPSTLGRLSDAPAKVDSARDFAELGGVPWFPAIGDGAASNLGSGATRHGLAAINVGTSAALRVMRHSGRAVAPFGLFCYRVDAKRFLVGGAVSNAGNLREWCLRELNLSEKTLDKLLAKRPAPPVGLTVVPAWTAERAPTWDEEQTGVIHGINQHTSAIDLCQAITDATYHRLGRIADLLIAHTDIVPKFIVSGGIQKSGVAMQRFADVFGHPLFANDEPEASLRGAAIFALEKLGAKIAGVRLGRAVRPRTRWMREHAAVRARLLALEATLASSAADVTAASDHRSSDANRSD